MARSTPVIIHSIDSAIFLIRPAWRMWTIVRLLLMVAALMDMALATAHGAGVDSQTAWEALEPLVRNTVTNIGTLGPPAALTGPISRGDTETVVRHLNALREYDPELAKLYSAFGQWTIQLARRKGSIDESAIETLRAVLGQTIV